MTDAAPVPEAVQLTMPIKAGQIYRTKAKRGWRFVVVEQVRGVKGYSAYALLREVSEEGKPVYGLRNGVDRSPAFPSQLRYGPDGQYRLAPSYELVQR